MGAFDELQAISPQVLADGWLARVVHGQRLTVAVVEAEPRAVLPEHRHHNEQFGMVIEGSVIFRIDEEERTIGADLQRRGGHMGAQLAAGSGTSPASGGSTTFLSGRPTARRSRSRAIATDVGPGAVVARSTSSTRTHAGFAG